MPLQPVQDLDQRFKHLRYASITRVPAFHLSPSPVDDKENIPRGASKTPDRPSRKRGFQPNTHKEATGTNKLALSSKGIDSSKACVPVARRNERERNRVKLLNLGFARLRAVVPSKEGEQLSKISTLKKAIWYIEHLDRVLKEPLENDAIETPDDANDRVERDNRRIGVVGTDLGFAGPSSSSFTAYQTPAHATNDATSGCQVHCENSSPAKPKFPSPILPERFYPSYYSQESYCESDTGPRRALDFFTPVRRTVDTFCGLGDSGYGSSINSSGAPLSREKPLPYVTASPYDYVVSVTGMSTSTSPVAIASCQGWDPLRLGEISPLMTPTSSPSARLQWPIFEPTMR
uniref:BHLH domain-containing protein n=1 Tax=Schistocephalus solidus TaxID=70667 RepID=A0A0X3Q8U8_SCHSO